MLQEEFIDQFLDNPKSTRKNKKERKLKQVKETSPQIKIRSIVPKTTNQSKIFKSYNEGNNIFVHGLAGTGKSFISLYLSLLEILSGKSEKKRIVLVRSIVPTRDIGFLPGSKKDKMAEYEEPYRAICSELFTFPNAYDTLKAKGIIQFVPTSFIRGTTFNDSIVIADECQNYTFHELDSVITRTGENTKIIFCGDFRQSDLKFRDDKNGIQDFMDIIESMDEFDFFEMQIEDIVRSKTVKAYIIAKTKIGVG